LLQAAIQAFVLGGQTAMMRKKVCEDNKISTSMLGTWLAKQEEIRTKMAMKRTKSLLHCAPRGARFVSAETELKKRFDERRRRGRRVSQRWIFATMKQLVRDLHPGVVFVASRGWLHRCCRRFGIAMRTKSNCKRAAAIDRIPAVRQWLARYRAMLSTPLSAATPMDRIWGRFPPALRFNCDQVCASSHFECHPRF
jgi:hypothetical protein